MRELREQGSVSALATHDPGQLKTLTPPRPARRGPSPIDELWERKRKERGDG